MGEPTRGTGQEGPSETSAVPEGAQHDEGSAADPSFGDELQTFPPVRKSAGSLDLAAAADEPTQLIRMLIVAAHENTTESEHAAEWKVLLGHFERANNELARMQDPSHKHAKHGTL